MFGDIQFDRVHVSRGELCPFQQGSTQPRLRRLHNRFALLVEIMNFETVNVCKGGTLLVFNRNLFMKNKVLIKMDQLPTSDFPPHVALAVWLSMTLDT